MYTKDDVELRASEVVYQGHFRVELLRLRHRLYGGGMGPEISREILRRGDAVAVLPYDVERDEVVMVEQFRIGPYVRGESPWQLEIIAGLIEPGELADQVAIRESREEAGLALGDVTLIHEFYTSPGATSECIKLYLAPVDARQAGGVHGLKDEGEDIRVVVLPFDAAMAALREGRIKSSPAVVALQWLALNHRDQRFAKTNRG